MSLTRREFLALSAATAANAALPQLASAENGSAILQTKPARGPIAVSSGNGLKAVARAYQLMTEKNEDPLDAAIAGVNLVELDPNDQSVGLGGLPNEEGVVQLDASCMHGATRRAGAVGCLEGIATPSLVAKAVLDYTNHVLLVGAGAKKFALAMGFKEQNLLTEKSRQDWLRWKARLHKTDNWLDHDEDVRIKWTHGTINLCALDANGNLGSVTTTSGLSWKLDGRLGDSPIIGAGQYCDNRVGAAGSTGRGESNIKACGAFLTVELMRQGVAPEEACLRALQRAVEMSEDRLLDEKGRPRFDLQFYALTKDGRFGAASMYQPPAEYGDWAKFAIADANGARHMNMAHLYKTSEMPKQMW